MGKVARYRHCVNPQCVNISQHTHGIACIVTKLDKIKAELRKAWDLRNSTRIQFWEDELIKAVKEDANEGFCRLSSEL